MSGVMPFSDVDFQQSDIVMLDTCVLLNFFGYGHNFVNQECQDLIKNGTDSGAMFVYSVKALEEISEVITRNALKEALGLEQIKQSDIKNFKDTNLSKYTNTEVRAQAQIAEYLQKIRHESAIFPEALSLSDDDFNTAMQLQGKYYFPGHADAEQLAIAIQNQIPYLATNDKDFNSVNEPGINILLDRCAYQSYLNSISKAPGT